MNRIINILIAVVTFLIIVGVIYWYIFLRIPATVATKPVAPIATNVFVPFTRTPAVTPKPSSGPGGEATVTPAGVNPATKIDILRLLSSTPVGGYGASTTASTTAVRWVDRGRGNIYEAKGDSLDITTISNTLLPRVYESWWNKNDTSFIAQYFDEGSDKIMTVITNIQKRSLATETTTKPIGTKIGTSTPPVATLTPIQEISGTTYELKGKVISGNIVAVATSPKRDRVLLVSNENDHAIGYVANIDGTKQTQLFDFPFSQVIAEWPEENTIAIMTKSSTVYSGYLYFINVKTGAVTKILGDIRGLSTKVSKDATRVLYSNTAGTADKIKTSTYDVKTKTSTDLVFKTLADKCVWSSKFKEQVYCAVPSQIPAGAYPDDWYFGKSAFVDNIWILNAKDNEIHQVANLLNIGKVFIDAINLQLDANDDFLFFMNKNNMSLWSLDLISSN